MRRRAERETKIIKYKQSKRGEKEMKKNCNRVTKQMKVKNNTKQGSKKR